MRDDVGRKPTDLDYGLGEHSINADALGMLDKAELTERLIRTFSAPSYTPPRLPAVAMELLQLSQDPNVEFDALESVLERDAILVGEVLSIARSAHYSGRGGVGSLHQALVRIGMKRLRQIVMEAAMNMRVFRSKAYSGCMERLQQHSRAVAHLCRIGSHYTSMDEEQAFLCGLMHDVGIAGILLTLGDVKRGQKPPDLDVLWTSIDAAHAPAGARMVQLWGLPGDISMVVGGHHQVRIDGQNHPLAATVCLAEAIAIDLDLALAPGSASQGGEMPHGMSGLITNGRVDHSDALVIERARDTLQLSESQIELIRSEASEWAEKESKAAGAVS